MDLKSRRRSDYSYWLAYPTRWSDNDQYSHMNNAVYYHLFDSIINTYLIHHCTLSSNSPLIGLVVSSHCSFFSPVSFPQTLDLGLRVNQLGTSSVTYEVGIFTHDSETPVAVGGYTHVFVGRESRKSRAMTTEIKDGLNKLYVPSAKL